MRILVFSVIAGRREVIVIPARHAHMAPLTLRGTDKLAFREAVREAVEAVTAEETRPFPRG